jgi:hypothetical protein
MKSLGLSLASLAALLPDDVPPAEIAAALAWLLREGIIESL